VIFRPRSPRPLGALLALLLATSGGPTPVHAAVASRACEPPRTRVALLPLTDATDHSWAAWSGGDPAAIVLHLLADSLRKSRGREVTMLAPVPGDAGRPVEDAAAIAAANAAGSDVVVTGSVAEFTVEERRVAGKLSRWGAGALDARARARVRVSLRVLDTTGGGLILETTIDRERTGRGTTSAARPGDGPPPPSGLLAGTLDEVLRELTQALDRRLDMRWQATVLGAGPGDCVLDAGAGRGLFVGQRLEVWRSGVETYDEDFVRLAAEVRVGAIEIIALEGRGRAHARVVEGEASSGDHVRPCAAQAPVATTLRR
jgi:hypothetical protein